MCYLIEILILIVGPVIPPSFKNTQLVAVFFYIPHRCYCRVFTQISHIQFIELFFTSVKKCFDVLTKGITTIKSNYFSSDFMLPCVPTEHYTLQPSVPLLKKINQLYFITPTPGQVFLPKLQGSVFFMWCVCQNAECFRVQSTYVICGF